MIGKVLGNYRITGKVGTGGMGIVYSAEHVLLGKSAAIKVLKPERCEVPEVIDRFFNEARAASMVKDPGIPEIFDYGRLDQGNAYLIMEMLEGKTLGAILKESLRLSPGRSLALTRLMAGTLKATHELGIIHRDLKPDNVFVVADAAMPRGERIKILDFGIAKLAGNNLMSGVQTETGRLMGTPYYMSPEQCKGAGDIDHRTDIYSLGCVLYQMLTGRPPFSMQGAGEVLAAHIHVMPRPVIEVEPTTPSELSALTMRLLDKTPDKRPQTMESLIEALNHIATYTEMRTPEPSLAASKDINVDLYQDTIDEEDLGETPKNKTTLEASSGEFQASPKETWTVERGPSGGFQKIVMPAILLVTLGFGGWGAWTVLDKKTRQDNHPSKSAAYRPAQPNMTKPTLPEPTLPEPTVSEPTLMVSEIVEVPAQKVRLTLKSKPSGAIIYRTSDGVEVGRTPRTVMVLQGDGKMTFLLRKPGFQSATIAFPVTRDSEKSIRLKKSKGKNKGVSSSRSRQENTNTTGAEPKNAATTGNEANSTNPIATPKASISENQPTFAPPKSGQPASTSE